MFIVDTSATVHRPTSQYHVIKTKKCCNNYDGLICVGFESVFHPFDAAIIPCLLRYLCLSSVLMAE